MPWTRSTWTDAGQIAAIIDADKPAPEAAGQPLHAWHADLVGRGELAMAVEFMGHALSRYDCVAWATRSAIATGIVDRSDPMIVRVLQWIDNPDDPLRRAAFTASEAEPGDSPAKLLCLAVWFSGGSLAPDEFAPVQPPADICARLATAALLSGACAQPDPDATFGVILELGEALVTAQ